MEQITANKKNLFGPYFDGQVPEPCGCFYPDVTLFDTDPERRKRILYCRNHGKYEVDSKNVFLMEKPNMVPTDEWRKKEIERMSKTKS